MRRSVGHPLKDLHGAVRLAVDGTRGVVDVVESMHGTVQRWTLPVGRPAAERTFGITGLVYRRLRKNVDWVGGSLDAALAPWIRLVPETSRSPRGRDVVLAALNGVWGDHLDATNNPLALPMSVSWPEDRSPSDAERGGRLLVLVHGLCMDGGGWTTRGGHDHGAAISDAAGMTPLYLQYNSGLPVADNGRSLTGLLEAALQSWPQPVEQVTLLGYSMGGLVARSACRYAELEGHGWRSKLSKLITLGTPHLGSPVERGGAWLDGALEVSAYSAPLARLTRRRSAGIADLGHGNVTDTDREVVPLPDGVRCYALAAVQESAKADSGRPPGDGLVPVDSALGRDPDSIRNLDFPKEHRAVVRGVSHLGLVGSRAACEHMIGWAADGGVEG